LSATVLPFSNGGRCPGNAGFQLSGSGVSSATGRALQLRRKLLCPVAPLALQRDDPATQPRAPALPVLHVNDAAVEPRALTRTQLSARERELLLDRPQLLERAAHVSRSAAVTSAPAAEQSAAVSQWLAQNEPSALMRAGLKRLGLL